MNNILKILAYWCFNFQVLLTISEYKNNQIKIKNKKQNWFMEVRHHGCDRKQDNYLKL